MYLTEQEKSLISFFSRQHGIFYARNQLILTDGVATTEIASEDTEAIDLFAKVLNWEDRYYINYLRRRYADCGFEATLCRGGERA